MSESTLDDPDLHLGLLAIRNEFVNLSELKHCIDVRRKIYGKSQQAMDLGEVLVQQRYLTPQDLEYLHMLQAAEPAASPVQMTEIEAEFEQHVAELKTGSQFAAYRIEQEIGRGGMGIVFRAANTDQEDLPCALKILIGGKDATVRDIERFKKEATVMAPLIHPGIVKIHEVGRHKGLDFIAMEFVDGVSLKELVGEKPLAADIALLAIRSSSEAVGFMHSHGIIHRDIKPENIMMRPDGSAVLMDFGLAGWDKIEILAGRGSIGTPMYQPPEQADVGGPFGKISPASDVYGLGATLYYLLTGRHPFLGRTVKEVRDKIKSQPPDPIRQVNPKTHPAAEALCLRCLRKRQNERFQTPKELTENIDKVLGLVVTDDPGAKKALGRLTRRVAAAKRKRNGSAGSGEDANKPKSKKMKAARGRSTSGRGGFKSGSGKVAPAPSPRRRLGPGSETSPAGPSPAMIAIAAITVLLGVILGAIVILS